MSSTKEFKESVKLIKDVLAKEKRLERDLKEIQKLKLVFMRILCDDEYCDEILRGKDNE